MSSAANRSGRVVIAIAALVGLTFAGCGKDKPEPSASKAAKTEAAGQPTKPTAGKPVSAEPAGKVVNLSGSATATRAGAQSKARTLAVNSDVFGDDTVQTSVGGRIGIVLHHNKALWSLSGGKSRRVDASAAWKVAAGRGMGAALLARAAGGGTVAAGRHSEKEAAESAESAVRPAPAGAATSRPATAEPVPEPEPLERPKPAVARRAVKRPRKRRAKAPKLARIAKPAKIDDIGLLDGGSGKIGGTGKGGLRRGSSGMGFAGNASGKRIDGSSGGLKARSTKQPKIIMVVSGIDDGQRRVQVQRTLRRARSQANGCYKQGLQRSPNLSGKVVIKLIIGKDGRVLSATITSDTLGDPKVATCINKRLKARRFPAGDQVTASVTVMLTTK